MSMSDPISDMLTRIRNASNAKLPRATMPSSKLKASLAETLKDAGYIEDYKVDDIGPHHRNLIDDNQLELADEVHLLTRITQRLAHLARTVVGVVGQQGLEGNFKK